VDAMAKPASDQPAHLRRGVDVVERASDLNLTINRAGGNAETRYNWQLNAHNRASDWFF